MKSNSFPYKLTDVLAKTTTPAQMSLSSLNRHASHASRRGQIIVDVFKIEACFFLRFFCVFFAFFAPVTVMVR